jgi:hypothetical protein
MPDAIPRMRCQVIAPESDHDGDAARTDPPAWTCVPLEQQPFARAQVEFPFPRMDDHASAQRQPRAVADKVSASAQFLASGRQADTGARARVEVDAASNFDATRHGTWHGRHRHLRSWTGSAGRHRARGVRKSARNRHETHIPRKLAATPRHATAFARTGQRDVDAGSAAIRPSRDLHASIGKILRIA